MSETVHLKLPYLDAAQAQKHVTHNEALRGLDTVVQLVVLDSTLTAPPMSPAEGDRYVVAATATGDWAGEEDNVATFVDGAWQFAESEPGWIAFDLAADAILVRETGGWAAAGGHLGAVEQFGVNATPDATNRLAVRSNAVLFSNVEAANGGDGDVRFVINKETDGDTVSLLFQSNFSGRAEVGLAGDTDLVFKVSADGSAWTEAIRIDKDTGLPTILYDNATSGLTATNVQDAIDEVAAGGGGGAVSSVFGRTGVVVAAAGDYDASQVDNDSGVSGATVADALDALDTALDGKIASSLLTTRGDIVVRGASAPDRLALGAARRALVSDGTDAVWGSETEAYVVEASDDTTPLTAGTGKKIFFMPYAFTVTEVIAFLKTPQTSGSIFTVDINESGASILSTKLTIDNTEPSSVTAATPAAISDATLAKGAAMTVDIDQVGDGTAKGLVVALVGYRA